MITNHDIEKLKTVFVTKKEFFVQMKAFEKRFDTKLENTTTSIISEVFEAFGKLNTKMDLFIDECRSHRKILENHETRLIKLEQI